MEFASIGKRSGLHPSFFIPLPTRRGDFPSGLGLRVEDSPRVVTALIRTKIVQRWRTPHTVDPTMRSVSPAKYNLEVRTTHESNSHSRVRRAGRFET